MLWIFVKLSLRKLWIDRSFSLLSISGLTLATAACSIILMYVAYEKSYDNFRPENIYRIAHHGFQNNVEVGKSAQVVPALAPAIRNTIPEVKSAIRFAHTGPFMSDPVMQYGEKNFRESRIYFAEEGFLQLFKYSIVAGNINGALAKPDQVAISQSVAKKYFGTVDPIGKSMTFHRSELGPVAVIVTAVFEDIPANAHFHTDFVTSFSTLRLDLDQDWLWGNFYTYIETHPGTSHYVVEQKIPAVLDKYIGPMLADFAAGGYRIQFTLQPIHTIHLESNLWGELEANGDLTTVNFLFVIAVFILFIAWINYINFAIARSSGNIKEISIRKISGSSRSQLIAQLITDSALINVVATCLSLAIVQALLPSLKVSLGLPEALSFNANSLLILLALFVAGTFSSGLYPAVFISRLNPVSLLRNRISRSAVSLNLNRALIIFQFTASIVLITGTITVIRQLNFIRNRSIGLNLEQTLIVKGPAIKDSTYSSTLSYFTNETRNLPGLSGFAVSSSIPGEEIHWGRSFYRKESPENSIGASIVAIDENFFTLYDADFISGRNFSDASTAYQDAVIINETMARELGMMSNAVAGNPIIIWNEGEQQVPKRVIGVVRDFNQQSFKRKIEPIVFTLRKYVYAPWAGEYYSFKISGHDLQTSISDIENLWKKVYPENPFDYLFLDEYFDAQYRNDQQFGKVFTMFAAFAIIIASLGLFGLTAYMISIRTKEIGVRKVLGSSSFQLVHLLSSSYLILVIIAFVVAIPISYWLMTMWLSQFEYRVNISVLTFIMAGAISFLTALITVGYKSWSAANLNPAEALKYE